MENLKLLGEKLKKARTEIKYSQNQVADYLGIQREQISYYETGAREITLSLLSKISDFYGKNVNYFFNLEEKEETLLNIAYRAVELVKEDKEKIEFAKKFVINLFELEKIYKRWKNE